MSSASSSQDNNAKKIKNDKMIDRSKKDKILFINYKYNKN
tara:strand:+ start:16125 stop:16244 length:120 start_codon:yes stop_codon:yes gene_type:complete